MIKIIRDQYRCQVVPSHEKLIYIDHFAAGFDSSSYYSFSGANSLLTKPGNNLFSNNSSPEGVNQSALMVGVFNKQNYELYGAIKKKPIYIGRLEGQTNVQYRVPISLLSERFLHKTRDRFALSKGLQSALNDPAYWSDYSNYCLLVSPVRASILTDPSEIKYYQCLWTIIPKNYTFLEFGYTLPYALNPSLDIFYSDGEVVCIDVHSLHKALRHPSVGLGWWGPLRIQWWALFPDGSEVPYYTMEVDPVDVCRESLLFKE